MRLREDNGLSVEKVEDFVGVSNRLVGWGKEKRGYGFQ